MQYVAQQHQMGCEIAAVAMVLDMSYEEVSETLRPQDMNDMEALLRNGRNASGLNAFEDMIALARTRGKKVVDFQSLPDTLKPGVRYLGRLRTNNPLIHHIVAIDEQGIVFDPDPEKAQSRESWRTYDFIALLEFQPLSAVEQLSSGILPNAPEEGR
jgi:hypothetical protein